MSNFHWEPGAPPPPIEEHSFAKLEVLRLYLRTYIDTLNQDVRRDEFRLDLVDGFAGGGLYSHDGGHVPGSPLVMLEESEAAERRLNEGRNKPLRFDVRYHFVERDRAHAAYLRSVLAERGYVREDRVMLYTHGFSDALERIVSDIARHQPRSGRSIFLLDQCGYTDADIDMVRRIGERLPSAEVILTVSVDAMLNFATRQNVVARIASTGIDKGRVEAELRGNSDVHPKALMQRALPTLAVNDTAFNWFTPFFLRPETSRRDLWFVHFSREAKARDVMLGCHWKIRNAFAHYGESFGLNMLGYEALERNQVPLLTFKERDREDMIETLAGQLVAQLHHRQKAQPLTVLQLLDHFGNRTAATIEDLGRIVVAARDAGEIDIVGPDGRPYGASLKILKPNDGVVLPPQRTLSFVKIKKR